MKDAITHLEIAIDTLITNGAVDIKEGREDDGIERLKRAERLKLAILPLEDFFCSKD